MSAVLSIDLASRSYRGVGICILRYNGNCIEAEVFRQHWKYAGSKPECTRLADHVAELATTHRVRVIMIDGPQAWKDPANESDHWRICEQQVRTQGKTGLPGHTKPSTFVFFAAFSIALFDRLTEHGWERLKDASMLETSRYCAVETYPTAAWRALGMRPLPSKSKTDTHIVGLKLVELASKVSIAVRGDVLVTHDELQAIVGGLAGIAAEGHPELDVRLFGVPPFKRQEQWFEGYIALPSYRMALS
jgi:predicted nuclease with RNAse H fold